MSLEVGNWLDADLTTVQNGVQSNINDMVTQRNLGVPSGCLDIAQKNALDLITNNAAFKNIKEAGANLIKSTSADVKAFLQTMEPVGEWTQEQIDSLISALDGMEMDIMPDFIDHTWDLAKNSLSSVLGIVDSMQQNYGCSGDALSLAKEKSLNMVSSLTYSPDIDSECNSWIAKIGEEARKEVPSQADFLLSKVQDYSSFYTSKITNDVDTKASNLLDIRQHSEALTVTNQKSYSGGFDLLKNYVATDELKNLL